MGGMKEEQLGKKRSRVGKKRQKGEMNVQCGWTYYRQWLVEMMAFLVDESIGSRVS
jgi:hypothetical protein